MKSVNVQHNDIKFGELLIDENNKLYLCDFGWGSVNNQLDAVLVYGIVIIKKNRVGTLMIMKH